MLFGVLLALTGFILIYFFGAVTGIYMFWSGLIIGAIGLGLIVISGLKHLIRKFAS